MSSSTTRTWFSERYRRHPWLTIAVGVYLLFSAAELARILLFDRPATSDAGFYAWEETPAPTDPGTTIRFHWSGSKGAMLRPVDGTVLNVLLYATNPKMVFDEANGVCLCVVRRGEKSGHATGTLEISARVRMPETRKAAKRAHHRCATAATRAG